jgi:hypothetical protein
MPLLTLFSDATQDIVQKITHALRPLRSKRAAGMAFVFFIALEIALFGLIPFYSNESSTSYQRSRMVFRLNSWLCLFVLFLCFLHIALSQSLFQTAERLFLYFQNSSLRFTIHLFCSLTVLSAAISLATGTLSSYAKTVFFPPNLSTCRTTMSLFI